MNNSLDNIEPNLSSNELVLDTDINRDINVPSYLKTSSPAKTIPFKKSSRNTVINSAYGSNKWSNKKIGEPI